MKKGKPHLVQSQKGVCLVHLDWLCVHWLGNPAKVYIPKKHTQTCSQCHHILSSFLFHLRTNDLFSFSAPQPSPIFCAYSFSFCSPPFVLQELLDCITEDGHWAVESKGIRPDGENPVSFTQKGFALGFKPGTFLLRDCPNLCITTTILSSVNSSLTTKYFFVIQFLIISLLAFPLILAPSLSPLFCSFALKF